MDVEKESQRRREALKILDRASRGEEFAQLFAQTSALAKDREIAFEDQLSVFYSLLSDLLELASGIHTPLIRNVGLRKDLDFLAKRINLDWVIRALRGLDQLAAGARRNLNKQLGLEAFAAELAIPDSR
jgi:hypothetical protein